MKTNSYRSRSKLFRSMILSLFGVLVLCSYVSANDINMSWNVNLSTSNWDVLTTPSYQGMWDGLGIHIDTRSDFIDVGMLDARLAMESSRQQSYTVSLPFDIHISAPDNVRAGQYVFLDSNAVLSGTPTFTTSSDINYNTNLNITTRDVPIIGDNDISVHMQNVGYGGASVNFNGSAGYTDTTHSADQKLTRTVWKKDPYGNPLNMPIATQFEGYELQNSGRVDAWEAEIDVLQFAGNFAPVLNPISAAMDISVGAGLDIIEQNYLQTQFLTGYYTDDGVSYDDFLINGATQRGSLLIPDDLDPGDTYSIQMTALGLGFSVLSEYFLQGNVDFDLELLSLFEISLGEIDVGSGIEVEDWLTRYQHLQFMNPATGGFLTEEEFENAVLSFNIIDQMTGPGGTKDQPPWGIGQGDELNDLLSDTDDVGPVASNAFPYNPQPGPSVVRAVPEPSTILLLGCGLLGLAGQWRLSRRRG